jgi:hypothetical protein
MIENLSYCIKGKVWIYQGKGAWFFLTIPKEESKKIKFFTNNGGIRRGWGSIRGEARIGKTIWKTSIFPNSKEGVFLLPIKKEIRQKEMVYILVENTNCRIKIKA